MPEEVLGNVEALDVVLADPRVGNADAVVVGGDAVPEPFAARVLDLLKVLAVPVHWVRGTREREVAEAAAADGPVAGWPGEESVHAALIEPIAPSEVTRIFEDIADSDR